MVQVIALANETGGVGKTTGTVNLANALAQGEQRVLAISRDPQASLTVYFGQGPRAIEQHERTIYGSLIDETPIENLVISGNPGLLPSSIRRANAEPELKRYGNLRRDI